MKDLCGLFEAAGCANVRTYIQSGNVVFEAPAHSIVTLPKRIALAIGERFGHAPIAVIRTAAELREAIDRNPFAADGVDSANVHLMFLADAPAAVRIRSLDPDRSPGDRYKIVGRDLYLVVASLATTKLTNAYFDAKLATTSTGRNWRTVLALAAIAGA